VSGRERANVICLDRSPSTTDRSRFPARHRGFEPGETSALSAADRRVKDAEDATDGDATQREVSASAALVQSALAPATSNDALRLAIKLAVDAGEYERAAALLDVARRKTTAGTVTPIGTGQRGR